MYFLTFLYKVQKRHVFSVVGSGHVTLRLKVKHETDCSILIVSVLFGSNQSSHSFPSQVCFGGPLLCLLPFFSVYKDIYIYTCMESGIHMFDVRTKVLMAIAFV